MKFRIPEKSIIFAVIPIVLVTMLTACELKVPIKEMSVARLTISRAVEVKAEKYAPEELKTAKEQLMQSHEYIKNDDTKKAQDAAEKSLKSAMAAIDKSLPLLAKDSLDEAKQIYAEADKLYAEKYAPEEFTSANAAIKESETLLSAGSYWESYKKSQDAIRQGKAAREKSLAAVPALMKKIEDLKAETDALWKNRGDTLALEELKSSDESLKAAGTLLSENSLKEASAKIEACEKSLKAAKEKIYRAQAEEKLTAAREALKKASASEHHDKFKTDIDSAANMVNESSTLFDNGNYSGSIEKSDAALKLLNSVMISFEKAAEEKRIEEERKAALAKKGEEIKKETGQEGEKASPVKETEYTVKYNPANRDCLWRIAQKVYKDARKWPLIYIANRDKIKDPDLIFPGQKLVIPPVPHRVEKEQVSKKADEETPIKKTEDEKKEQ